MDNSKPHNKLGKQQTNAPGLPPDAEARVILVRFTRGTEYLDHETEDDCAAFAGSEKRGFLCWDYFWISIRRAPFPSWGITNHDVNLYSLVTAFLSLRVYLLDSFVQPLLGLVFLASRETSHCSVAFVSTFPTIWRLTLKLLSSVSGALAGYFFTKVRVLEFLEPP